MAPIESAPPVLNDNIVVRSNYNPKAKTFERPQAGDVEFLISPLTGERIPASKMSEHMRIGLLDPAWVEQRKKEIAKVFKMSNTFLYIFKRKKKRKIITHKTQLLLALCRRLRGSEQIFSAWKKLELVAKSAKRRNASMRSVGMVIRRPWARQSANNTNPMKRVLKSVAISLIGANFRKIFKVEYYFNS